jgi:hypothetical protein
MEKIAGISSSSLHFLSSLVLILALVTVTACVQSPGKNITPVPGPAILVDYHRSGGIGGFDDHLVIFENGALVISSKLGSGYDVLNKTELDDLKALFDRSGFLDLMPSYPPVSEGADYFTYQVAYRGKTVSAVDTGVPPRLETIIAALNEIIVSKTAAVPQPGEIPGMPVSSG